MTTPDSEAQPSVILAHRVSITLEWRALSKWSTITC